jgi:hypothetical protein
LGYFPVDVFTALRCPGFIPLAGAYPFPVHPVAAV